ncbi:O-antigen ligase [Massilia sp. 9096]|uniref:O-antigen ligase family protein n=1 Tax=Massilia sp. 9096 TaxID=1500894 RepID=UPI000A67055B|nr:O-antigen ligase family protein [Massilia sp. 9096]
MQRQLWATILAALFPLLSLVTDAGIGVCGFLFLATALWWRRDAWAAFRAAWPRMRWVGIAFLLDLAWVAILMLDRTHDPSMLDRPLRMCLMMAAIPVVLVARPPPRALWLGAAAGALGSLALVALQGLWLGVARPGGWMNPITFGDLALCLALLSLAGAIDATRAWARWTGALGVLAGLAASLLSGSRGGWLMLALLVLLPLLLWLPGGAARLAPRLVPRLMRQPQSQPQRLSSPVSWRLALALPLLAVALAALAYAQPQTGVRDRIAIGVSDMRLYLAGNRAPTSLSVRLELWRGGLMLVHEHPWVGLDTPAYKRRMREWIAEGKLSPAVFAPPEPPHLHNDLLQVLVTRGIIGLAAWIGILLAPLAFFWRQLRRAQAPALAGLLLVLAYASFGLTEVIFWSMKANVFYALTVFLLIGWVLDAGRAPVAVHTQVHGQAHAVDEP